MSPPCPNLTGRSFPPSTLQAHSFSHFVGAWYPLSALVCSALCSGCPEKLGKPRPKPRACTGVKKAGRDLSGKGLPNVVSELNGTCHISSDSHRPQLPLSLFSFFVLSFISQFLKPMRENESPENTALQPLLPFQALSLASSNFFSTMEIFIFFFSLTLEKLQCSKNRAEISLPLIFIRNEISKNLAI